MTGLISRRNFLKGSAIIGSLAVAGGFGRAVENGVFSTGKGAAYSAWETSFNGLEGLVNAAILAANAHNAQPWLFKLGTSTIELGADASRNLGPVDPYLREMYISLGCALENLIIAAKANGYSPKITYFPDQHDSKQVAGINLTNANPLQSEFYDAIPKRHMNRGPYDTNRPVTQEQIESLMNLKQDNSETKLFMFDSQQNKLKIGEAMIDATKSYLSDKGQTSVDPKWMRQSWQDIEKYKDGITTDAQGLSTFTRVIAKILPPLSTEQDNKFWLNTMINTHVRTAAAYGFITISNLLDYGQVVKAGQLYERLHLWATAKGLGMQVMNQLSERRDRELSLNLTPTFGDKLHEILGTSELHSIIQFRIGYPTIQALSSPRRPVKDVLVSTNK